MIKDGGDDPDITEWDRNLCKSRKARYVEFTLVGGEGVGVVTKEGLFIEKRTSCN